MKKTTISFKVILSLTGALFLFNSHSLLCGNDIVKANGLEFEVERGYPKELLEPYNFSAPAGPVFTKEEINRQYERGDKLEEMIYAAYSSGQKQLIIPPGDYRMRESGSVPRNTDRHSALQYVGMLFSAYNTAVIRLDGLRRPDDNPLHIIGKGVTVWFTPTDKPRNSVSWGFLLKDCANIIFDGFIFDAAIPTTFGGRVTKVEADKWRLELELGKDSKTDLAQLNYHGQHGQEPWAVRIFPFNKQGRYMTATYDMDPATWPPAMCAVERVEASKESNRVWLYFAKELKGITGPIRKSMLEIMSTKAWQDAYGEENTITPGCFIYGQWGISVVFDAINCKQITLVNMANYHPASFFAFTGGYGGHTFINVKGIPRPGTCRLFGGYATGRFQDLEHGPVFDRVIQYHNEDDGYHICGHYYSINKVNGRNIEVDYDGIILRPGVAADVSGKERESWLARDLKITKVVSSRYQGAEKTVIELDREIAIPEGSFITFPEFNNDGWVIRNSYFINVYQRLLNQGGRNAVFENNYVYGVGCGLKFESQYEGSEGGRTENIVIRRNIIAGTSYCQTKPNYSSIIINTSRNLLDDAKNVVIEDNIIFDPGLLGIWMDRTKGGAISGNVILNPLAPYAAYNPDIYFIQKAIAVERSSDVAVTNNLLIEKKQLVCAEPGTGEWFAAIDNEENRNVTSSDNRYLADVDGKLSGIIQKIITGSGPVNQMLEEIHKNIKGLQPQMVKALPGKKVSSCNLMINKPRFFTLLRGNGEETPAGAYNAIGRIEGDHSIGGITYQSWLFHPPYGTSTGGVGVEMRARIDVPSKIVVYGAKSASPGDGVVITVRVKEEGAYGDWTVLASATVTEASWQEITANFEDWVDKDVLIQFIVDCGPANDAGNDAMYLGGAKFVPAVTKVIGNSRI